MMLDIAARSGRREMTTHLLLTSNFPPLYDGIASWMSQLARHYGGDAMLVSLGSEPGHDASDARQSVRVDRLPMRARALAQSSRHHRLVAARGEARTRA